MTETKELRLTHIQEEVLTFMQHGMYLLNDNGIEGVAYSAVIITNVKKGTIDALLSAGMIMKSIDFDKHKTKYRLTDEGRRYKSVR